MRDQNPTDLTNKLFVPGIDSSKTPSNGRAQTAKHHNKNLSTQQ